MTETVVKFKVDQYYSQLISISIELAKMESLKVISLIWISDLQQANVARSVTLAKRLVQSDLLLQTQNARVTEDLSYRRPECQAVRVQE